MVRIHASRRDTRNTQASGPSFDLSRKRMRRVGKTSPWRRIVQISEYIAIFNFDGISRNDIAFETRFASAITAVKFPVVPRANKVIAVEIALAKRPANMIAFVGNDADDAVST